MKTTQEVSGNINTQTRVKKYVSMESSYSMSGAIMNGSSNYVQPGLNSLDDPS